MLRNTMMILFAALFAFGCATTPDELVDARATYQEATASNAAQYAPTELREAKKALNFAEHAFDKQGNDETTRTLAYVAKRKAQGAMVSADVYAAQKTQEQKQELLLSQNEQARRMLTSRLQAASQYARMTSVELKNEREKLEGARSELSQQKAEGEMTEAELAEKRAKLDELEQKLAAESEARKQAEANLADTKAELAKVASIKEEAKRLTITLSGEVLFELGDAKLRPVAERRLDQVAEVLLAERNAKIVVQGHTDSQGSDSMNQRLSKDRADSVRSYLIGKGIASDRIDAVGKGESDPIAPNDTPSNRANNRRVEIVVDRESGQASL